MQHYEKTIVCFNTYGFTYMLVRLHADVFGDG